MPYSSRSIPAGSSEADAIIRMHHGEIRERGTHNELLRMGGIYRTLYELQYKEQAVAQAA